MATVREWAELLLVLHEFVDEVNDALDWILWAQEATGNIAIDKAPPPSPRSPDAYQKALEKTRDRISGLPLPTFEAKLPSTVAVPTNGFDATRTEIRSRINDLSLCVAETADARSAIKYFALLEETLGRQIDMLRELEKVLWDLQLKFPVVDLLAFQALNVQGSYIPFVGKTQDIAAGRGKAAKEALTVRLGAIRGTAIDTKNVLLMEGIDLKATLDRLAQLDAEVLQLQEAVVKAVENRDRAQADMQRLETLRDAAQMDVEETEARLEAASENVNRLTTRVSEVTKEIAIPYKCPLSGVSWDECTALEHVNFKNEFSAHQQRLSQELNQLQQALETARNQVASATSDLAKVKSTLASVNNQLASAKKALQGAEAKLQQAKADWKAKAAFVTEEKHMLRADIFAAENTRDKMEVEGLMVQLGDAP